MRVTQNISRNPSMNFPIYEVVDSSEGVTREQTKSSHTGNVTLMIMVKLTRSSRIVVPSKLYDKRLFVDILDQRQNVPGQQRTPFYWNTISHL